MNAPENRNLTTERGNGLMPTKDFFTAEYHQLEKERVFKKSWLRVGNEELIPNVGDYFVKELESCDTSVIVVRGRDKRIRAFHNNCSHRNNRIAYLSEGNTNGFKCRFHSWAYGLDGKLMAIPDRASVPRPFKSRQRARRSGLRFMGRIHFCQCRSQAGKDSARISGRGNLHGLQRVFHPIYPGLAS